MKRLLVLTLAGFLPGSAAAQAPMNPATIKWGPPPTTIPKGAQMAVISGDPSKEGIFVFRVKFPAGYAIAPHHHSTDEYVTVISGALNLGMGKKLQRSGRPNLVAGGFAHTTAGMDHYVYTRSGATIQIMGEGPFTITYVNPKDDPRNH